MRLRPLLLHPYRFAALALVLEAVAAVAMFGTGVEGLQALARYSGRAGLLWFALVFSIAPLHRLAPGEWTRLALRRRRSLGLAFGAHHLVHLVELLTYLEVSGKGFDVSRAAGGMVGYAFLVAMMLTSTDKAVARLGAKNWKRLHRTGLWYLWIVFLLTYLPRVRGQRPTAGGGPLEWSVCLAIVVALAALRLAAFTARRRSLASAVPGN
jgi:DMSO/TMAO reductase YedYZ heme-binding membrane subunit